jgi:predicted transcriptional regulator
MANILFYLGERKHDMSEIKEKMAKVLNREKIIDAVEALRNRNYVVKEDEFYTINIERLLVRQETENYLFEDLSR